MDRADSGLDRTIIRGRLGAAPCEGGGRVKPHFAGWPQNARLAVLLVLLVACFLWGGGSRLDIAGLMIVQPVAVLCIAAALLIPGPIRLDAVRVPLLLLCGLALVMAVQLIPLPPALWESLPGHAGFADIPALAGAGQSWRPLSLTPDLTLASMISLVVPAAALIAFAGLSPDHQYRLLPLLLLAIGFATLLGLGQIVGGPQSDLYRYEITNRGVAVGVFSNRNHQAVLLAMAFPMLALWTGMPIRDARHREIRRWVAAAMAILLIPMLLVTGSRAGLALGLVGLGFAWLQLRASSRADGARGRYGLMMKAIPVLAAILAAVAAIVLSRALAVDRFFATPFSDDARATFLPVLLQMAKDFFPLGSGFGSFDPLFRAYEPFELLRTSYMNHAHNDLLELVITGGLPALVPLVLFIGWTLRRAAPVFRACSASRREGFARLALAMIVIILGSSLVDYPLRTPLLAALFALACGWLGNFESGAAQREAGTEDMKNALPG